MSALRDERRNDETDPAPAAERPRELLVDQDERILVDRFTANGREMTRYRVVTRDEWIASLPADTPESVRVALGLAGAWSDLDDDEMDQALWRIRHATEPTPPIEFDDDSA